MNTTFFANNITFNLFNDKVMIISFATRILCKYLYQLEISIKYDRENISENDFTKLEGIFIYVWYLFGIQFT